MVPPYPAPPDTGKPYLVRPYLAGSYLVLLPLAVPPQRGGASRRWCTRYHRCAHRGREAGGGRCSPPFPAPAAPRRWRPRPPCRWPRGPVWCSSTRPAGRASWTAAPWLSNSGPCPSGGGCSLRYSPASVLCGKLPCSFTSYVASLGALGWMGAVCPSSRANRSSSRATLQFCLNCPSGPGPNCARARLSRSSSRAHSSGW